MAKKVTFTLPAEIAGEATSGLLLGDFNNWDESKGTKLKKEKNGSFSTTISLEPGTYSYRYFLNDGRWVNDNSINSTPALGLGVENCVIMVEAEMKKGKAPKAKKEIKAKAVPATKPVAVVAEKPAKKAEAPTKKAEAASAKKAAPAAKKTEATAPAKKAEVAPAKKAAPATKKSEAAAPAKKAVKAKK